MTTNKPRGKPLTKGNKLAKGGKRPGAGMKPADVVLAAREFWSGKVLKAGNVIEKALDFRSDCPWPTRVKAAEIVLDHAYGKPKLLVDVSGSVESRNVLEFRLNQIHRQILAEEGAEQPTPASLPFPNHHQGA